jgi:hypothetical protein
VRLNFFKHIRLSGDYLARSNVNCYGVFFSVLSVVSDLQIAYIEKYDHFMLFLQNKNNLHALFDSFLVHKELQV